MDNFLAINTRIRIPLDEFEFSFVRSSGPGGQNVNKVNSKAVLRWPVRQSPSLPDEVRERFLTRHANKVSVEGDLVLTSQRYRDQQRNIDDCLEKVRLLVVEVATLPKKRRPTKVSRGAKESRLQAKREQSGKKQQRRSRPTLDS